MLNHHERWNQHCVVHNVGMELLRNLCIPCLAFILTSLLKPVVFGTAIPMPSSWKIFIQ